MSLPQTEPIHTSLLSVLGNEETTSLLALLLKGGWVMYPILLLSILAVYTILERLIVLYRVGRIPQGWIAAVHAKALAGDAQGVTRLCAQKHYVMASIIKVGIAKLHKPIKAVETAMEQAGQRQVYRLEKNLAWLGIIAGVAPMLGFLGTVIGMIQAFMAMSQETHHISPQLLSGGIYEAMITTAAGLVVGIIANLGYNYLSIQIQKATQRLEQATNDFIELIGSYPATEQHDEPHEATH